MEMEQIKNNKLQKILQFSIPCIIAMLLQTAITVTDGFFTGNYVGEHALAAINLGLPVLYFYLGAGLCVGVGGKYAIYHFKGYPQFIYMVYQKIFCRWLAKTGNQLDERRIFDIYRQVRDDGYMEIDICFSLK